MTGSGSVCYGVFKSEKTAKDALKGIKFKYPKYCFCFRNSRTNQSYNI